jgi:hypothetical protein
MGENITRVMVNRRVRPTPLFPRGQCFWGMPHVHFKSDEAKGLSPSWREVAARLGVGVHCVHIPERFTIFFTDATRVREFGFRAVEALLPEGDLRAQLSQAGFSRADIETAIQVARRWATTRIR